MHPVHVLAWIKEKLESEKKKLDDLVASQKKAIDLLNENRRKSWFYKLFPSLYKDESLYELDMSWFLIERTKRVINECEEINDSALYASKMNYEKFEFVSDKYKERYSNSFYSYCRKNKIPH